MEIKNELIKRVSEMEQTIEKYDKADKRNITIIQGENFENSKKKEVIIECIKNTLGVEMQLQSCWEVKNGIYAGRFNSLDDKVQIMCNSKSQKRTRISLM